VGTTPLVSLKLRLLIGIAASMRAVLIPGEAGAAMMWEPRVPSFELTPEAPTVPRHVATP
jgi:hypothetical protein